MNREEGTGGNNNNVSTQADRLPGPAADIQREPERRSAINRRNNRLDSGTDVGTSTPIVQEVNSLNRSTEPPYPINNYLNNSSSTNNINNMASTGGQVSASAAGRGSGDPTKNFQALGSQNAAEFF